MKREQFEAVLVADGWEKDRFGHYQLGITGRRPHADYPVGQVPEVTARYRVKMQALSCRIEVQVRFDATIYGPAKNEWVRWDGDYYSKIVQLDDGRIRVGYHFFGRRKQA